MAKRARLTVDDVVQQCADSDDDYADFEYDPDEPVMEGSDDEFSDLEGDEPDDDPDTTPDTPASSSAGASTSSGDDDSTWSTTIKRLYPSFHLSTRPYSRDLLSTGPIFLSGPNGNHCEREQCIFKNSNG